MLLTDISPRAAKLHLALSTLSPPKADPPTARIRIPSLARLLYLSPRSCAYALRELQSLNLITRLPRRGNDPALYQIHPFPYTHPTAGYSPDLQPVAALTPPDPQPVAPLATPALQPIAAPAYSTPIPASKTPPLQPAAAIKPNRPTEATADPLDSPLLNPALLQFLMNALSPEEKNTILAP